jgi:hypothetical protein
MAREQRRDVDYFPHECNHGRKMHIIESKYGNNGYAAWFKLLEELGKANNHYIDISDDMTLMFLTSVFKLDEDTTKSILTDLSKLGAIDKFLYEEYSVVWSQKFVNSIEDAYRKRKQTLFTKNDILELYKTSISGGNPPIPRGLNEKEPENGQTDGNQAEVIPKVKYSRVNKSKEEKSKVDISARKLKFSSTLEPYLKTYGRELLKEFNAYWTEPNKSGSKFRQELERTWDLERRLGTWAKNDKNFKPDGKQQNTSTTKQAYEFSVDRVIETHASNSE